MTDVSHLSEGNFNLFSLTRLQKKGWTLSGDADYIKLPKVLEMANQGAIYSANNWSIGGRTRHIDVCSVFLHELKEAGILVITWLASSTNEADIFTKNLDGPTFQRYTNIFTGGTDYD